MTTATGLDGIVVAGGPGRRIGRAKATIVLDGVTLVERAIRTLASRCGRVVVVTRDEVALPALPVDVLHDRPGPASPLLGVATGLAALSAPDCVVLACDLPLAAPVVDALVASPAGEVVVARDPVGRLQPLCARYPRAAALEACEALLAAGSLAMGALVDALGPPRVIDVLGDELLNVNDPADLTRAARILAQGSSVSDTPS